MVNLNMIDTIGSGIRRIYDIQKKKYFPMPDYDLSEDNRVKVTLYGKIIDENYSKILFEKTNLDIEEVMLLDRVQKGYNITKAQSDYLRRENLIEGRYPNIYISSNIAKITNQEKEYIEITGLDNKYYKDYILIYIKKFGKATREEINNLIYPKLPINLDEKQKSNRVRTVLTSLKNENKIKNIGSDAKPYWIISE